MEEDKDTEVDISANKTVITGDKTDLTDNEQYYTEQTESENTVSDEETVPDNTLRKDTKEALIVGAVLGLAIGIIMFLIPNRVLEEGARLTICVILILLGPRLMVDKYHIDFTKGRYTMAGGLGLVLLIYILMGHPIN